MGLHNLVCAYCLFILGPYRNIHAFSNFQLNLSSRCAKDENKHKEVVFGHSFKKAIKRFGIICPLPLPISPLFEKRKTFWTLFHRFVVDVVVLHPHFPNFFHPRANNFFLLLAKSLSDLFHFLASPVNSPFGNGTLLSVNVARKSKRERERGKICTQRKSQSKPLFAAHTIEIYNIYFLYILRYYKQACGQDTSSAGPTSFGHLTVQQRQLECGHLYPREDTISCWPNFCFI